jgi:hypothetical protein
MERNTSWIKDPREVDKLYLPPNVRYVGKLRISWSKDAIDIWHALGGAIIINPVMLDFTDQLEHMIDDMNAPVIINELKSLSKEGENLGQTISRLIG